MISQEEALKKPMPTPDADSAELWQGLQSNTLLLQKCQDCSDVQYYRQSMCRNCLSDNIESFPASGKGTIYSFSVVHRAPGPAFKGDVPYAVVLVELEEGPRMISSMIDTCPEEIDFDAPVELVCEPINDEITLPRFRLRQ